jgi:hypothetical protein
MLPFLARSPRALVLRNALKPSLNFHLAINHANQLKVRAIVWRVKDTSSDGAFLSNAVLYALEQADPTKTGTFSH